MNTHIKQKNCPCRKGEYCTNGLKCTERNCLLIKSSTVFPKPLTIQIDMLKSNSIDPSPLITDKASHLRLNIRDSDGSMKMNQ